MRMICSEQNEMLVEKRVNVILLRRHHWSQLISWFNYEWQRWLKCFEKLSIWPLLSRIFSPKRNVQTFLQNSPATHGMQITIPISTSLTIFFPVVCLRCKMKYYTQYLPNPFYWSIVDKCHYSILLIGKWGVWSQNNMYIYTANIRTNRHPDTAWMDWVRVWATGEWGRVVNSCSIYMCVCRAALFSTSTRIHGIHIVYQSINESLKEMYWMMHKTYKRIQSRLLRGRVPSVHVHAG